MAKFCGFPPVLTPRIINLPSEVENNSPIEILRFPSDNRSTLLSQSVENTGKNKWNGGFPFKTA
jgi:hypothetical protein